MALHIYNVLGREKQPFVPLNEGRVGMYVCGPTVYDAPHIGHAKNYTAFDVVVRWLRKSGYQVLYVQNITDVGHLRDTGEDPIQLVARRTQSGPMQVAEEFTWAFFDAMDALGNVRPDISPRAAGHIPEQIKMVETLLTKGYAYVADGSVYFDVKSMPEYGKRLANRKVAEQEAGERVAERGEKRNPEDFALWKRADPDHILRWDSPWGEGFPGWHIECSAMARKYLGDTFDLHGGGVDNLFPHNESEIAQSECANGVPFANYWMLVGSLTVNKVKMSKSLKNFVTIMDMLERYRPQVIRTFMQQVHYSQPIDYSDGAMEAAGRGWERLANVVQVMRHRMNTAASGSDGNAILTTLAQVKADFAAAMDNDFNTPIATATLSNLTREVNTLLDSGTNVGLEVLAAIEQTYRETAGDVLGIMPSAEAASDGSREREAALIEMLIQMRAQARVNKNWAESDRIRDELAKAGVVLEDRADGTVWKIN
jgi:cysteinyl-tRNA synthetase